MKKSIRDSLSRGIRYAVRSIEVVHIPQRGIWTTVGLSREQFFGIVSFSLLLFLFLDGPAWRHLHDPHTLRIIGSYGVIPLLVAAAQWQRRTWQWRSWLEASILLALLKFFVSAILLIALAFLV